MVRILQIEAGNYEELKLSIKSRIIDRLDKHSDTADDVLCNIINEEIIKASENNVLSLALRIRLRNDLYNSFRKLDILQELVDDKEIAEIMINSYKDIFIEKRGKLIRWDGQFESKERYDDVIQQIVSRVNRVVNESSPIVDARLLDGSRVNVVLNPVALQGSAVTIRKFPEKVMSIDDLISRGTLTPEVAEFLDILVKSKYNILLSGGTSSGKTTMLNALAGFIPSEERIITIEDSAELQIVNIPNIVKLEVKNANVEGGKNVEIRDLIKASLRMRPDRIIVGEVRDSAAIDLLSAYNTGHDGSISTAHSNSTRDMISRLESMVIMGADIPIDAIRRQISSAIDIIIHVARLRDKSRKIVEIAEVLDVEDGVVRLNNIYTFKEKNGSTNKKLVGQLERVYEGLINQKKIDNAGYRERYDKLFGRQ